MKNVFRSLRPRRIAAAGCAILLAFSSLTITAPVGHAAPAAIARSTVPAVALASPGTDPNPGSGSSPSTSYSTSTSDFSMALNPARLVVGQADIGTVQKIDVINHGTTPMSVVVQKRDFLQAPDGSLSYQESAPYSASGWVSLEPTTFTVPSGQAQTVTATITAPAVTEPGDHQLAVAFIVPSQSGEGNIKINRGIALPVFITVPGPVDTTSTLSSLSAPGFSLGGAVTVTASVQNVGTVHRDFRAPTPLAITSGDDSTAFPDFTVTRDAVRDVSTTWDPPLMCICTPTVSFVNADGSVESAEVQVIVFPLHILGLVLLAVALVVLAVRLSRRRYRASVLRAAAAVNRPVTP